MGDRRRGDRQDPAELSAPPAPPPPPTPGGENIGRPVQPEAGLPQAEQSGFSEVITAHEAKCIRIALIFGDPGAEGQPDDNLERAKAKLLAIEKRG